MSDRLKERLEGAELRIGAAVCLLFVSSGALLTSSNEDWTLPTCFIAMVIVQLPVWLALLPSRWSLHPAIAWFTSSLMIPYAIMSGPSLLLSALAGFAKGGTILLFWACVPLQLFLASVLIRRVRSEVGRDARMAMLGIAGAIVFLLLLPKFVLRPQPFWVHLDLPDAGFAEINQCASRFYQRENRYPRDLDELRAGVPGCLSKLTTPTKFHYSPRTNNSSIPVGYFVEARVGSIWLKKSYYIKINESDDVWHRTNQGGPWVHEYNPKSLSH